jgi:cytochrome c553
MRLGIRHLAWVFALTMLTASGPTKSQTSDDRYLSQPRPPASDAPAPRAAPQKSTQPAQKKQPTPDKGAESVAKRPASGKSTPAAGAPESKSSAPRKTDPQSGTKAPAAGTKAAPSSPPAPAAPVSDRARAPSGNASAPQQAARVSDEQFGTCLACHGRDGQSETPETPSLAGQPAPFITAQLTMMRDGKRKIPAMETFVGQFSEENLRRYVESISKLPKLQPPATAFDAARFERGKATAASGRCATCHNTDFSGAGTNPRLAHQREDYLLKALLDYRSGARVDQGAIMAASAKGIGDAELGDVAHYLAHLR